MCKCIHNILYIEVFSNNNVNVYISLLCHMNICTLIIMLLFILLQYFVIEFLYLLLILPEKFRRKCQVALEAHFQTKKSNKGFTW